MTATPDTRRPPELFSVAALTVSFGVVNFDMFGVGFLMPFIAKQLALNNTQVGLLFAGFWLSFAISCALGGALLDATGKRHQLLSWMLVVFAVASVLPGLAGSFRELLLARIVMGLVEGPMLPAVHSIVSADLPRVHRGMNMGIVQTVGGSILGVIVAPLVLLPLASHRGWHWGFFLVIVPALLCAALIRKALPPAKADEAVATSAAHRMPWEVQGLRQILGVRNLWLCAIGASFVFGFVSITLGFLPLFLMQARGMQPAQTSLLVSLLGISSAVVGVLIPALSDRIGRKPVVIGSSMLGVLSAVMVGHYVLPIALLAITLFLGWTVAGTNTLLFATIPSESAPDKYTATVIGAIGGIAPIIGGVLAPALAGWSADRWGLSTVLTLTSGCAVVVSAAAIGLHETRPIAQVRSRGALV